jgi:hypothetical protein
MKQLFTFIWIGIALLGYNCVNGQALQVFPADTFTYGGVLATISDSHEQNGYFVNNTANNDSIYWRVVSATMDSTWQLSFCDPENCYYYSVGQSLGNYGLNRFWAVAGSSYQLRFGVTPYCVADSGKMVVVAWLANDSAASSRTFYYFVNYTGSCATAVTSVAPSVLKVYPSPVSSNLAVTGLGGYSNVKLTVYDMLGNVAIQKLVTQPGDIANISTEQLHEGVYILTVENEGTRLLTKRIEKLD